MKVLVLVKEIEKLRDQFEINGPSIDDKYLEYEMNEWDKFALEEAVQTAEAGFADEIIVVTIGPERSEETIRNALARGADRAIRIWDEALEDITLLDVQGKTEIFSSIIQSEEPELVFTGVQAGDDMTGATGVALADTVDFAWVAVVNSMELDHGLKSAQVHRELEGGITELTETELPAVITVQTGLNQPRYASLRGIRKAQKKDISLLNLEDLEIHPSNLESPIQITGIQEPQSEEDTTFFEGSAEQSGVNLAEILRDKGVGKA